MSYSTAKTCKNIHVVFSLRHCQLFSFTPNASQAPHALFNIQKQLRYENNFCSVSYSVYPKATRVLYLGLFSIGYWR